jgi:hypothetical protein
VDCVDNPCLGWSGDVRTCGETRGVISGQLGPPVEGMADAPFGPQMPEIVHIAIHRCGPSCPQASHNVTAGSSTGFSGLRVGLQPNVHQKGGVRTGRSAPSGWGFPGVCGGLTRRSGSGSARRTGPGSEKSPGPPAAVRGGSTGAPPGHPGRARGGFWRGAERDPAGPAESIPRPAGGWRHRRARDRAQGPGSPVPQEVGGRERERRTARAVRRGGAEQKLGRRGASGQADAARARCLIREVSSCTWS